MNDHHGGPKLTVVGGTAHSGKVRADQGKRRPTANEDAIRLLQALIDELRDERRSADQIMVVHTIPPTVTGHAPDIDFAMSRGMTAPEAYWVVGRLQQRLVLLENSGIPAVTELLEDES